MRNRATELDFSETLDALDALAGKRVAVASFPAELRAEGPAMPAVVVVGVLGILEPADDEAGPDRLALASGFFPVENPDAPVKALHPNRPGFSLSAARFARAGWMGGGLRIADHFGGYILIDPLDEDQ
jgi:hypothetical protein